MKITSSVRDINQRSRFSVATRGQDGYIVLNQLKVRWKSVASTARQTNMSVSYNKNIILIIDSV